MLDRRELLFAGGAAGLGGVLLAMGDEKPKPAECKPGEPCYVPPELYPHPQPAYDMPVSAYSGVVLDLPPELRTQNWGGGSCVHASTCTLLKWLGQYEMAEWWRNQYSGGENDTRLIQRMEAAGLKYCWSSDPSFFDWCTRTRRGAGIFYKPSHSINFVGRTATHAKLLDNNAVNYPEQHGDYESVEWNTFVDRWHGYGSFAWSMIYDPPAGTPT